MGRLLRAVPLMLAVLVGTAGPARADDETFIIVIRTGADQSLAQMKEVVDNTLRKLGNGDIKRVVKSAPDVLPLTPAEYGAYARIQDPRAIAPKVTPVKKDGYEFAQIDGAVPTWQLQLKGSPIPTLNELTVRFADGSKSEPLKPGKDDTPLRAVLPGTYLLRLADRAKTPVGFNMKTQDVGGGAAVETAGEWPAGDNFYLIRMDGFKAELRQDFEKTIKSSDIPNPLETFAVKKGVTLAIAEGDATDDEQVALKLDGHRLYLSVPRLRQKPVVRAWVLFPLKTAQDAKDEVAKFKGLAGRGVGDKIRDTKPVTGAGPVVLAVGAKGAVEPRWIELPLVPEALLLGDPRLPLARNAFGRVIYLVDQDSAKATPDALRKLAAALPELHSALVYEFEDNANRSAQSYKRQPTSKRQLINEYDFPEWPQLVRPLLAAPPGR